MLGSRQRGRFLGRAHGFSVERFGFPAPDRCRAAGRTPPRLRPCAAAPDNSPACSRWRSARSSPWPAAPSPSPPRASSTRRTRRACATARTRSSRSRRPRASCSSSRAGRSGCSRAWACARPSRRPTSPPRASPRRTPTSWWSGRATPRGTSERNNNLRRALGVPVFVMPGGRLEDIERGAVALGVLTNHAEAGRALALSLRRQRQDVARRLAKTCAGHRLRRRRLRQQHPAHHAARPPARARGSAAGRARRRRHDGQRPRASQARSRRLRGDERAAASRSPACAHGPACGRCARSLQAASTSSTPRRRARTPRRTRSCTSLAHSLHPTVIKQ